MMFSLLKLPVSGPAGPGGEYTIKDRADAKPLQARNQREQDGCSYATDDAACCAEEHPAHPYSQVSVSVVWQ